MSNEMEIKVTTYEEERLNYFERLMRESQYRYNRLFKRFKNAPIMSAEAQRLSDAGREVHFHGDVVEMLEKGYRKQSEDVTDINVGNKSEWISVDERLPEDVYGKYRKKITVLVCTESGKVGTTSRQRIVKFDKDKLEWVELDTFEWSKRKRVTHWMPLPEAPQMKGESK